MVLQLPLPLAALAIAAAAAATASGAPHLAPAAVAPVVPLELWQDPPVPDPSVATPEGVCASATVLAYPVAPSDTLQARACNVGVNWLHIARTTQDVGVSWSVTTPRAVMRCAWAPFAVAVECDWPNGNVPALPGGPVVIRAQITAANLGAAAAALEHLGPKSL